MWSFLGVGDFRSRSFDSHGWWRVPREHPCPIPGTCCPGPAEWFGLYLMAQQSLGKCLNYFWIWMAIGWNRVSPLRDGVESSHGLSLNISLICPSSQKTPSRSPAPPTLCLPQLWSSELFPLTKRTGNWLGFVAFWHQNCLLLCSSGGKKLLQFLSKTVLFLFLKNWEETLLFKLREPNSILLSFWGKSPSYLCWK